MKALIAGLPRSGSTLLSNLLNNPSAGRICLNEPLKDGEGGIKQRAIIQLAESGINAEHLQDINPPEDISHWGVKEVWPSRYSLALDFMEPDIVLLVVRDLRDALSSFYRQCQGGSPGDPNSAPVIRDDKRNMINGFLLFVEKVKSLGINRLIVPYHRLVGKKEWRDKIGEQLGWPLNGDPNFQLPYLNRADEVREGLYMRKANRLPRAVAVANQNQDYQRCFGYLK